MKQRVEAIDAVRGFALFGILLVNMTLIQFGMFSGEQPTYVFENIDAGEIGLFSFLAPTISFPYFLFYLGLVLFCYKRAL